MTGESIKSSMSQCGDVRIGLALGSGSARGLAHLGVIRALEEAGIQVDFVAGTSIGALVGAIYAAGKLEALEATVQNFEWKRIVSFFDVVFPKSGLIDGAKVGELVRAHVHVNDIETLPIPFCAVATDIQTGDEIIIRQGDVIDAVRASISVPGIFTPVCRNGHILVDGGLTNPVPVSVVRAMGADIVIAVDLNHDIVAGKNFKSQRLDMPVAAREGKLDMFSRWVDGYRQSIQELKVKLLDHGAPGAAQFSRWVSAGESLPSIFEVLLASINIMETRITQSRLEADRPDILIQPPLGHIRFLDFGRAEEIIEIGYDSARGKIDILAAFRENLDTW